MIAVLVTIYFWWQNTKGIEESSDKALKVMQITTVMVVMLLGWGFYSVFRVGAHLPPLPVPCESQLQPRCAGLSEEHQLRAQRWDSSAC